jgi:hypothetical protein
MRIDFKKLKKVEEWYGDDFEVGCDPDGIILRFGYWKRVPINELQELIGTRRKVIEHDYHEEDCGWLYHYTIT